MRKVIKKLLYEHFNRAECLVNMLTQLDNNYPNFQLEGIPTLTSRSFKQIIDDLRRDACPPLEAKLAVAYMYQHYQDMSLEEMLEKARTSGIQWSDIRPEIQEKLIRNLSRDLPENIRFGEIEGYTWTYNPYSDHISYSVSGLFGTSRRVFRLYYHIGDDILHMESAPSQDMKKTLRSTDINVPMPVSIKDADLIRWLANDVPKALVRYIESGPPKEDKKYGDEEFGGR